MGVAILLRTDHHMTKRSPPVTYPAAQQRDAIAESGITCPTCGGPWNGQAIKVCRLCGRVIGQRDKWRMVPFGPGLVALEHMNCESPTHK